LKCYTGDDWIEHLYYLERLREINSVRFIHDGKLNWLAADKCDDTAEGPNLRQSGA
jgi:hypothetical protein